MRSVLSRKSRCPLTRARAAQFSTAAVCRFRLRAGLRLPTQPRLSERLNSLFFPCQGRTAGAIARCRVAVTRMHASSGAAAACDAAAAVYRRCNVAFAIRLPLAVAERAGVRVRRSNRSGSGVRDGRGRAAAPAALSHGESAHLGGPACRGIPPGTNSDGSIFRCLSLHYVATYVILCNAVRVWIWAGPLAEVSRFCQRRLLASITQLASSTCTSAVLPRRTARPCCTRLLWLRHSAPLNPSLPASKEPDSIARAVACRLPNGRKLASPSTARVWSPPWTFCSSSPRSTSPPLPIHEEPQLTLALRWQSENARRRVGVCRHLECALRILARTRRIYPSVKDARANHACAPRPAPSALHLCVASNASPPAADVGSGERSRRCRCGQR